MVFFFHLFIAVLLFTPLFFFFYILSGEEKKIIRDRRWKGRSESDHVADSCLAVLLCLFCFPFFFSFLISEPLKALVENGRTCLHHTPH
jgi:hypothetical protein